jgi:hypothetical protein
MILLFLVRLVAGESAHAMSHHGEAGRGESAAVAQSSNEPSCPDHAGTTGDTRHSGDAPNSEPGSHHGAAHDPDCCKTVACQCLCVHMSAIVTPSLAANLALLDQGGVPVPAAGLIQNRLSAVFRPPA